MNLPKHATAYLLFIGILSLFQVVLGANLIVLAAIVTVCLAALYPMTRKTLDPNDILMVSFSLYYGTFSLILKCLVLQPVQMNLVVPMKTSAYLVGGFGMIFLSYLFVQRVMTRHYPKTRLRRWTWLEKAYANNRFLARFTLPFSLLALAFVSIVSLFSHSAQEVATGLASSGGIAALSALNSLIQLAFAMQLALLSRRGSQADRVLAIATFGIVMILSMLNNQKQLAFMMIVTYAIYVIAFRVRLSPRFLALGATAAVIAFLYMTPVIHIVRGLQVEKSQRISMTLKILAEAHYNPAKLLEIESKLPGAGDVSYTDLVDYLAPSSLNTDRFTQLMPIDQMARADFREPLGLGFYLDEMIHETLPKYIVGEHRLEALSDYIAWHYSIREDGVISRPALGLLGTGFGVSGPLGLLLLAPFLTLVFFALVKITCNGSISENPWAVFIASFIFFNGEADITIMGSIFRSFLPVIISASALVAVYTIFNKDQNKSMQFYKSS